MSIFDEYLPDVIFQMQEQNVGEVGCTIDGSDSFDWVLKTSKDLFANKRVLIFGLPGAFTPTCSNNQLPGYEALAQEFYDQGVDEIWCTSVNDAFVMNEWGRAQGLKEVKLLPDGNGDFADALGFLVKKNNLGFGKRSWRYAMLVDDLIIKHTWMEEGWIDNCPVDPYDRSAPEKVLAILKEENAQGELPLK